MNLANESIPQERRIVFRYVAVTQEGSFGKDDGSVTATPLHTMRLDYLSRTYAKAKKRA